MARYIDADLMMADVQRYLCANCSVHCPSTSIKNSACDIAECLRMIDNAPTANVEPMRHGRWIVNTHKDATTIGWHMMTECSECGYVVMVFTSTKNFCANCGAKMDLKEGE